MRNTLHILLLFIIVASCKQNAKQENQTAEKTTVPVTVESKTYPKNITKIFDAHGGVDKWSKMNALTFSIKSPKGAEITTTNLKTRSELIDAPNHKQGYDGRQLWVQEKDNKPYKGNAKFYKGLMFYFYAMPFVFADEGIVYEETESLIFEGKTYPGILVSYNAGIGSSSNDQYKIFYNSETGQMEWLAYTVTFGKNEKSTKFNFIRYNNWEKINGLLMPKAISWYKVEEGVPTTLRNTVEFLDVKLSESAPNSKLFMKPEAATVIE